MSVQNGRRPSYQRASDRAGRSRKKSSLERFSAAWSGAPRRANYLSSKLSEL
jgi:hypothetical protein